MSVRTEQAARRRSLGQVRTPRRIAEWMTRWACADGPQSILEPAAGDGVFVQEIATQALGTLWRPHVVAYEVDEEMLASLGRSLRFGHAIDLDTRRGDFITSRIGRRFDCAIANPPYVRHHTLQYPEKVWQGFDRQCGGRIRRATNLYGLFMLKIWSMLGEQGRAAIITPAEWLNAEFGMPLKDYLLRENAIDAVVHFHPESLVFEDALTTATITLLRRGRHDGEPVRLVALGEGEMPDDRRLAGARLTPRSSLTAVQKWTPLMYGKGGVQQKNGASLGVIADCRRGIATGANSYFTLRQSECMKWRLSAADLVPCITRASLAEGGILKAGHVRSWIEKDERMFLLKPRRDSTALRRYLEHGRSLGVDRRFLPSHRAVWYMPEERPPAPILISVFCRDEFRIILNEAGVLNLTAYHGIYPRDTSRDNIRRLYDYLRSREGAAAINRQRRIYGGGLFKLEPRDVESVEVPGELVGTGVS